SGSIEMSKVPRRRASSVISSLSMPISGLRMGIVAASSIRAMFESVCEATWPRLSPVVRASAPCFRASASAMRTTSRRYITARAHRESARTRFGVDVDEGLGRHDLDVDLELRLTQVDFRGDALEHERTELAVELHARHRVRLERAARRDPEGREGAPVDEPRDHRLHRLDGGDDPIRERGARHAADATHPFPDRRRIGMLVELEQDAAGNLAEVHRPDIGGCPSEISRQMAEEQRSVPALE